jgi:hypothetical protein
VGIPARAHWFQRSQIVLAEFKVRRRDIIRELLLRLRVDDDAHHGFLMQQPSERDPRH